MGLSRDILQLKRRFLALKSKLEMGMTKRVKWRTAQQTQHLRVLNTRKKSGAYSNTLASLASLTRKRNTEAKLCFANACEVRILFNQKREGDMYERTISISSFRVVKKVSQNFRMERWLDGRWCKKPFP